MHRIDAFVLPEVDRLARPVLERLAAVPGGPTRVAPAINGFALREVPRPDTADLPLNLFTDLRGRLVEPDQVADSVRLRGQNGQRVTIGMRAASKLLVEVEM